MRYYRIPSFTGINNTAASGEGDRGTLRVCENALPMAGNLRSGPIWAPIFADLKTLLQARIAAATTNKLIVAKARDTSGHQLAVVVAKTSPTVYSVNALAFLGNPGTTDERTSGVTAATGYEEFDFTPGTRPFYASRVGGSVLLGDGSNTNRRIRFVSGALPSVSTLNASSNYWDKTKAAFLACSTFVVGPDKCVYASGNEANPLRVYVAEPPDAANQFKEGVFDPAYLSVVDLMMTEASRITALGVFRTYVVVHTDAGIELLYRPLGGQASTGFRVEQTSSPTFKAAPNPACVGDSSGVFPFYVGANGQLFKDESARAGTPGAPTEQLNEIATWTADVKWAGGLGRDTKRAFATWDAQTATMLAWLPHRAMTDITKGYPMWLFDKPSYQYAGPFHTPYFMAATKAGRSSQVIGIDSSLGFHVCDLESLSEQTALGTVATVTDPGTASPRVFVGTNEVFFKSPAATNGEFIRHTTAFATEPDTVSSATNMAGKLSLYGNLSVIETAYDNLGTQEVHKNFLEVMLTFQKNSFGYFGVWAETETGAMSGRWVGAIHGKEQHKVFVNVRGKSVRLKILVVTDPRYPWVLRDASLGYLLGNTL